MRLLERRKIIISMVLLHVITLIGVFGFMVTEKLSFFDSLWLTIISMLTIGYGDLSPVTTPGKLLTLLIIPVAIGLATYMLAQFAGAIIGGKLSNEMRSLKMNQKIKELNHHIIVCGFGRVGEQVLNQLKQENRQVIVIEKNKEVIEGFPDELLFVEGNATEDDVLIQAGVDRASGVVVTLPNDADNVFITLTVKGINPKIYTVVRAEKDFSEEKLYRAGADKVINTSNIGGKRMAMAITKPISVDYVDTILHDYNSDYHIQEVTLKLNSSLINKTLTKAKIRENFGVNIVAIKRGREIINNPIAEERFHENDLLIVFGSSDQLKRFNKAAK